MVSLFTLFRDTNMDNVYTAARPLLSAGRPPEDRMKRAFEGRSSTTGACFLVIQIWTLLARAREAGALRGKGDACVAPTSSGGHCRTIHLPRNRMVMLIH